MALRAKRTMLIESESRILRLEVDPEASPDATAANVRIYVEESRVSLGPDDVARVRRALRKARPTMGGV